MTQRREYFRIRTFARVGLRVLSPEVVEQARLRLKQRHPAPAVSPSTVDESGLSSEHRAALDMLRRIALTLDRIDRRLDEIVHSRRQDEPVPLVPTEALAITLSGSGFSGPFSLDVSPGELVEVHLDLWDSGLPLITALASAVKIYESEDGRMITAFSFEEILPEDQQRIVQLTLRSQSNGIRESRGEEDV